MRTLLFLSAFLNITNAYAQTPTIVYGASETAPNKPDSYLLEQPENAPNPLGNPIITPPSSEPAQTPTVRPVQSSTKQPSSAPLGKIEESTPQNPAPFSQTPQQEQNQIENTLFEGSNRIYDVQSYPLQDIKTITEPNIDPTITTYPEY